MFLEIFPVLLGCPYCWHIMACNILMICISVILVVISSLFFYIIGTYFIIGFCIIESSLFFSSLAWIKVYQFCLFKKKKSSWFYWSFLFFSLFYLFCLRFYYNIFLILLTLGFVTFLLPLHGRFGYLRFFSFASWGKPVFL